MLAALTDPLRRRHPHIPAHLAARPELLFDGLGRDFDPDEFLRSMAGYVGLGAGCEYAVSMHRYPMG